MEEGRRQYITPKIEKRHHRRAKLVAQVRCEALDREDVLLTSDVSVGGIFVSAAKPFPSDSEVAVSFKLKSTDPTLACRGKVIYSMVGLGMGVQFTDLSEDNRRTLEQFVDESD